MKLPKLGELRAHPIPAHSLPISIPAPLCARNLPTLGLIAPPTSVSPGFGSRNGLGVSTFPGAGALPGKGGWGRGYREGQAREGGQIRTELRGRAVRGQPLSLSLGLGGGMKPQKPGEGRASRSCTVLLSQGLLPSLGCFGHSYG